MKVPTSVLLLVLPTIACFMAGCMASRPYEYHAELGLDSENRGYLRGKIINGRGADIPEGETEDCYTLYLRHLDAPEPDCSYAVGHMGRGYSGGTRYGNIVPAYAVNGRAPEAMATIESLLTDRFFEDSQMRRQLCEAWLNLRRYHHYYTVMGRPFITDHSASNRTSRGSYPGELNYYQLDGVHAVDAFEAYLLSTDPAYQEMAAEWGRLRAAHFGQQESEEAEQ